MLRKLTIDNYAIIDSLTLLPDAHLNIVTGETGAGKSIIVGALSLILGERSDTSVMMNKEAKSVVEGWFDVRHNDAFKKRLVAEGLDLDDECIIRREISASGKSRAFVNDTPVTLHVLNSLTSLLVDMHRQFDNMVLEDDTFQLEVLDTLGNTADKAKAYYNLYEQYKKTSHELTDYKDRQQQWQKDADYKNYLLTELVQADLQEDEIEHVELQLKQIGQSEKIMSVLEAGKTMLTEGEHPLVDELARYSRLLQGITDIVPNLQSVNERIISASAELKDILEEIEKEEDKISIDQGHGEQLQQRIDLGYKLLKKHGLRTTAELIDMRKALETELKATLDLNETIAQLMKEEAVIYKKLTEEGAQLSSLRAKAIRPFADKVSAMLALVGMPAAKFDVTLERTAPQVHGMDNIQFLLDANKSGQYRAVQKAASGGEMSRIMLCIKSLTAKAMQMPVLIFDEVDTGISGEAAKQVGKLLRELADYHQVICITHQPQIAAKATQHFYVYKEADKKGKLTTQVMVLPPDERILAIARMIGGEQPGEAAINNAKELIEGQ